MVSGGFAAAVLARLRLDRDRLRGAAGLAELARGLLALELRGGAVESYGALPRQLQHAVQLGAVRKRENDEREAEAEAQGLTVEELMRREREEDSACMSMAELNRRNEAEAARWDETDWGEDDRQEREWEEYKATRRLERMWG